MNLRIFNSYMNLMRILKVKPTAYAAKKYAEGVENGVINL